MSIFLQCTINSNFPPNLFKKIKIDFNSTDYWNYNTVERVLLSCLIIVCVCGVMFESDRFKDGNARPEADGFGAWVRFQQDIVTFMCIFVIFGSMFFYFCVAYSEVAGTTPKWVKKILCLQKKVDIHGDISKRGEVDEMEFSENPVMAKMRAKQFTSEHTKEMEKKVAEIEAIAAREKKRAAQAIKAAQRGAGRRGGRGKKSKKKKAGFGARKLRDSLEEDIEGSAKDPGMEGIELVVQNEMTLKSDSSLRPALKKGTSFRQHSSNGHTYYENVDTGETVWVLPEDSTVL